MSGVLISYSNVLQPKYLEILMPPLIAKWQQLSNSDKDLFPLLECFTSIAQVSFIGFQLSQLGIFLNLERSNTSNGVISKMLSLLFDHLHSEVYYSAWIVLKRLINIESISFSKLC